MPKNADEARRRFRQGAQGGDAHAMFCYGALLSGEGVTTNEIKESTRWLRRAHELGDNNGTFEYGRALMAGRGIEMNDSEGVRLFVAAARQGHANAFVRAACSAAGRGTPTDLVESYAWNLLALELCREAIDKIDYSRKAEEAEKRLSPAERRAAERRFEAIKKSRDAAPR